MSRSVRRLDEVYYGLVDLLRCSDSPDGSVVPRIARNTPHPTDEQICSFRTINGWIRQENKLVMKRCAITMRKKKSKRGMEIGSYSGVETTEKVTLVRWRRVTNTLIKINQGIQFTYSFFLLNLNSLIPVLVQFLKIGRAHV